MSRAFIVFRLFLVGEDAVTAAEYAMLLALILIGVITAVRGVGSVAEGFWGSDGVKIGSALSGSDSQ
ncbi:MAG: Flp family type IVb pilin [Planctomycetota bacterium]|nr:Flp family type IVb pilin [Planctomycetota bacterium]